MELTNVEQIELSYLKSKGFTYLVRNEIGSVEVFVNKPCRDKTTNNLTYGGYDTWVERAYPMTNEELKRRRNTELGQYKFITWASEPLLISKLIHSAQIKREGKKMSPEELQEIKARVARCWNDGALFCKVAEEDAPKLIEEVERLQKEVLFWKGLAESCECDQQSLLLTEQNSELEINVQELTEENERLIRIPQNNSLPLNPCEDCGKEECNPGLSVCGPCYHKRITGKGY